VFNPLQSLKFEVNLQEKITKQLQKFVCDAMWFYEIEGTRFTLVRHPVEFGVLSSRKNYYCVIMRENNVAVFLWRGNSQTNLNYSKAHELILDSKFRKEYEKAEKRQSMLITSSNSLLDEAEKSPSLESE
jgi:hypothetical protein